MMRHALSTQLLARATRCLGGRVRSRLSARESVVGFAERLRGALAPLPRDFQCPRRAIGHAACLGLGGASLTPCLHAVALGRPRGRSLLGDVIAAARTRLVYCATRRRRRWLLDRSLRARSFLGRSLWLRCSRGRRRAGALADARADAQPDVAQLALEPAPAHVLAGLFLERGGMHGGGDALDDRGAELVPVGGEQTAGGGYECIDFRPLVLTGRAHSICVAATGDDVLLSTAQGVPRREQLVQSLRLRTDELIDGPRRDRWLAQARDRRCLLAVTVRAQRPRTRGALGPKLVKRQRVEVVDVHAAMVSARAATWRVRCTPGL